MSRHDPMQLRHSIRHEFLLGFVSLLITIGIVVVGRTYGKLAHHASTDQRLIAWACAIALLIVGAYAVRHLATSLGRIVARESSVGAGATLRLVSSGFGFLALIFLILAVLGLSLTHLLEGAGLVSVVLGIAATQSLSNVFSAVVLLFARPFVVGDTIRVRSGVVGILDVQVVAIGLTYVTVRTDTGDLRIPNSLLMSSGVEKLYHAPAKLGPVPPIAATPAAPPKNAAPPSPPPATPGPPDATGGPAPSETTDPVQGPR